MGHVFRGQTPYTFPGGVSQIILKNLARVADVWLDDWREFYYVMNPGLTIISANRRITLEERGTFVEK